MKPSLSSLLCKSQADSHKNQDFFGSFSEALELSLFCFFSSGISSTDYYLILPFEGNPPLWWFSAFLRHLPLFVLAQLYFYTFLMYILRGFTEVFCFAMGSKNWSRNPINHFRNLNSFANMYCHIHFTINSLHH